MSLILRKKKMLLVPLLIMSLMVGGCGVAKKPFPTYPQNLNVIKLSDGGFCVDRVSAEKLATLRAELESW